jgi:enoyl-CoA hydratase
MADNPTYVTYERIGKVSVITLDRTPINVYDGAFHVDFQGAWLEAKRDTTTTVVLMKATGKHFCAGANIRDPKPAPEGSHILHAWEEVRLIHDLMKPTIAAVQGGCIGGGQRMVFPCDLIFCTEDAFFRDPTATMGVGGIQAHLHTWFYGPRLAKEMIYSGIRLPAKRLYDMGQVNRLYPDTETLHREALAFATEIAEQNPLALRQAKRASNTTMDIMGQHYILNRMEEILDDAPKMDMGVIYREVAPSTSE